MRREYKSGTGFCFWRWTDVNKDGHLYLRRLHLIQVPRVGAIMLHWIKQPDWEPDLHDHPVSFLSLILRGWYQEVTPNGLKTHQWYNFVRATDRHRITAVAGDLLTLVFAGPKTREWGYHTPTGFVGWKDYQRGEL